MFDLKDKVAIVTGSTRGIGRAIAEYYARAGAKVVISSRKQEACDEVAAEMQAAGYDVLSIPCHVGRKEDLQKLVDQTVAKWGKIDILVCNAATNPTYGPMSELSDDAWNKIMDTNVRGTFWLCNMVLPLMAENGGGSVILVSSIAALRANTTIGAYGISKAAEIGLTRNLAAEWGPKKIRVNAIAPGLVKTDFARALWEDPVRLERAENATPLRRIGEPEDIAGVALFLASNASAYVTGHVLVADGGETII
ncbi:MAG TPA: SDR family oxidoreductase [Gammaproteobacteria bacterium]|nr:SDR family oxidoreductase [Gammaproteobacteria bacterium]